MSSLVEPGKTLVVTGWKRLTANRWTVAFVVALVVQAIAQAVIQKEAHKTNNFGISILKGLEDSVGLQPAQLQQDSRATAAAVSASAALDEEEEDKDEEESEGEEEESESSSEEESGGSSESSESDEEDAESQSANESNRNSLTQTSAAVKSGTATPTGISPLNSPLVATSGIPPLKQAFAQTAVQKPPPFSASSSTPPAVQHVATQTAQRDRPPVTTTVLGGAQQVPPQRVHLATQQAREEESESDSDGSESESDGSESDDEDDSEAKAASERRRRLQVRRFRRHFLRHRAAIKRSLGLDIDTAETSSVLATPSASPRPVDAPAQALTAAPGWNQPGIAAPPSDVDLPTSIAPVSMTPASPTAASNSAPAMASDMGCISTSAASASSLLAKRDFPLDGVIVSIAANNTVEISGLAADSSQTIVVDQECAGSLTMPISILERQGTQAIALAAFDLWLLFLALFGLYQQSIPHLPAVWISKLAEVVFNVIQVVKIQQFHDDFHREVVEGSCDGASVLPDYWDKVLDLSIAGMSIQIAFFLLFTAFLWVLYRFIQWQSFRSIGADRRLSMRNSIHLVHSIIVFTGAFFILAYFALLLNELVDTDRPQAWLDRIQSEGVNGAYVGVIGTVTALAPFWLIISYFAASKRSLPMLAAFALGAIGIFGTAIFFLDTAPKSTDILTQSWPFFVFTGVFALLSFIATCMATVVFFFYERRFHRSNDPPPPPTKGFTWATDSPPTRRPTVEKHMVDVPEDPVPYSPDKEEDAPRYQSQYFGEGQGGRDVEQQQDRSQTHHFYAQGNSQFYAQASSQYATDVDARPLDLSLGAGPTYTQQGYTRQDLSDIVENTEPSTYDQTLSRLSTSDRPSQDKPSRFSMTSDATTALTRTTAASSQAQVVEIPETYKVANVPLMQHPRMKGAGVSRWSATATSTDPRGSWTAGDDQRRL